MSNARSCFIAGVLPALFAAQAAAEPAVIESKLNLRSGPGPAFGVIAVMPAGTKLDMQKCNDEWRNDHWRRLDWHNRMNR